MEVHHLVGKLSTAETVLTEVQRNVPTCPGSFLVINACNQGKNLCSPCTTLPCAPLGMQGQKGNLDSILNLKYFEVRHPPCVFSN